MPLALAFPLAEYIAGGAARVLESSRFPFGGVLSFALSYRVQSRGAGVNGRWNFIF